LTGDPSEGFDRAAAFSQSFTRSRKGKYVIEGDLRREPRHETFKRLQGIKCYPWRPSHAQLAGAR